ncbi:hypothetical protein [Terrimonas pollutisoli]|uniref:hypothetical protein n=1 Tax=Terrimonas pollutisoli TaxID=3034147 RepID=UPI0023EE1207|nr:hypothetical protein [Terrimonas sp. H1YJ31]
MSELLVIKQSGNTLSKKQLEFNKLILSLEKRRNDLQALEALFRKMVAGYEEKLHLYKKEFADVSFELIKLLDAHFESGKLKKVQQDKTAQMILNITGLVDAGENLDAVKRIASKYMAFQQKGMSEEEKLMGREMLKSMFSSAFGVDVDDEDIDLSNFSQMGEKLQSKLAEEINERRKENFSNSKHKSYNGNNKKLAEKAELLRKSWKMLYTQLVRKLHPDIEPDDNLRIEKTEKLKKVTAAYEHNDFYTLLHLYQQEIGFHAVDEKDHKLKNDHVLSDYIGILKKQDTELRDKIGAIKWEAENMNMGFITRKNAWPLFEQFILREQMYLTAQISDTKKDINDFADIGAFKKILGTIQTHQLLPVENPFFFGDEIDGMDDDFFEDFFAEKKPGRRDKRR